MDDPIDALPRSGPPPLAGGSLAAVLGSTLVEIVRRVVKDEVSSEITSPRTPPPSPWMTPPSAARACGVPVKTIRAWVRAGRIARRIRNRSTNPKQEKFLVNVDEVVSIAEQVASAATVHPAVPQGGSSFQERARQILAGRAARER